MCGGWRGGCRPWFYRAREALEIKRKLRAALAIIFAARVCWRCGGNSSISMPNIWSTSISVKTRDGAALHSEDVEERIPERFRFGILARLALPFFRERDGAVFDFIPREGHCGASCDGSGRKDKARWRAENVTAKCNPPIEIRAIAVHSRPRAKRPETKCLCGRARCVQTCPKQSKNTPSNFKTGAIDHSATPPDHYFEAHALFYPERAGRALRPA